MDPICYFCETHPPEAKSTIDKRLYLVTKRVHLGVARKVEYSYIPVSIPRCAACRQLHKKGRNIVRLSTAIGALLGVIGFLYGAIICGVVGYFIGRRLEKRKYARNKIKSAYNSSLNKYPLVAQKVQEGWTFTKPT